LAAVFDKLLAQAFAAVQSSQGCRVPFHTAKSEANRLKINGFWSDIPKQEILQPIQVYFP
jgi:hypothetical protein